MSLDLVESRPERGLGAISDSRGETIRAIAEQMGQNGLDEQIRTAESDDAVLSLVDNASGINVDPNYRNVEAGGAVDQYGAAPALTVEQTKADGSRRTNQEEKAILADAIRQIASDDYNPNSTAGSELSGKELRRTLRNKAKQELDNPDRWNIDARAGQLGAGRNLVILQDRDTNKTRTIELDDPRNPDLSDVDDTAEQFDQTLSESNSENGSGLMNRPAIIAAVVGTIALAIIGGNN